LVFVASRVLLISSFKTIREPVPFASGAIAVRVAFKRLSGPSALIAVDGPHRSYQDDGTVVLDRQIQEVCGLFERARANASQRRQRRPGQRRWR